MFCVVRDCDDRDDCRYGPLTRPFYKDAHACIIVFDRNKERPLEVRVSSKRFYPLYLFLLFWFSFYFMLSSLVYPRLLLISLAVSRLTSVRSKAQAGC